MTDTFTYDFTRATDDIVADYRAADIKGKAAMRSALAAATKAAIMAGAETGDYALATRLATEVDAAMVAEKKPAAAPVDYVSKVRDLRATLVAAIDAIDNGKAVLPDGVSIDYANADLSGGTPDEKVVSRMVTVSGRKVGRGSVADYIDAVLPDDDTPMTIAALRAAWSADLSADYPTEPPSAGAIGACLVRDNDDRFAAIDIDGVRGAVRTA